MNESPKKLWERLNFAKSYSHLLFSLRQFFWTGLLLAAENTPNASSLDAFILFCSPGLPLSNFIFLLFYFSLLEWNNKDITQGEITKILSMGNVRL